MARYNRWQNQNLYEAAGRLSDDERRCDRGAFFGSIHGTLSHLMWGDRLWMSRFRGDGDAPPGGIPLSPSLYPEWQDLAHERSALDAGIVRWADVLEAQWLAGELRYFSSSLARDNTGPRWRFVSHFFNHQTHHRGQAHCR